jgi:hypothetical protein
MTRHRRLRMLGLALAAAAAWAVAPVAATADSHRGERFERRDHGRYEQRDRGHYQNHDRWEHRDRDRWERRDRERWEQRAYGRRERWGPPRFALPYELYLRPIRPIASVRSPFYCREHHVGFRYRGPFDDHLMRYHHVPYWQLPHLVAHVGFGWTFGY